MLRDLVCATNRHGIMSCILLAALLLIVFPECSHAQGVIFGPKRYTRGSNTTDTFTDALPRCGGDPCQLVVLNGNMDGTNRLSSATVSLNGVVIFGPSDFSQQVYRLARPLSLNAANSLTVSLGSIPGSFLTISVECARTVKLEIDGATGVSSSIWQDGTVSLGIPLENEGNATANNVLITNLRAGNGLHTGPGSVPYAAGVIAPQQMVPVNSTFSMTATEARSAFLLTLNGTYGFQGVACAFQASTTVLPPPAGNPGQPKSSTRVTMYTADTATYPPAPPPDNRPPNAENEVVLPLGQPRNFFPGPQPAIAVNRIAAFAPSDQGPPAGAAPNAAVFAFNTQAGGYGGIPPDPSVAGPAQNGVAIISANTAVSYSTDYGKTFTTVNLTKAAGFKDLLRPGRSDFFPESDGGLCCDQVLQYIPSRQMFVWLLQYRSPNIVVGGVSQRGQNRLRIAYAKAGDLATIRFMDAWRWFDITPTTLGDTLATDWFDYPDMSFSQDWLYISVRHGFWNAGLNPSGNVIGQQVWTGRRWFVRASLSDMANLVASPALVYYEAFGTALKDARIAQSPSGVMYFADQKSTSQLTIFVDPDTSPDVPAGKDVDVTSFCASTALNACDYSVNAPDSLNWNVAPHGVLGATYVAPPVALCPPEGCPTPTRFVYFAFDAGRNNAAGVGRPFPYIRVVKIDADKIERVSEKDIFNANHAYATPGLTWRPGSNFDDVAMTLAFGGGTLFADNAVGFLNEQEVFATTQSTVTQTDNTGAVRYGDYFDVRNAIGPPSPNGQGVGYSTLGYSVTPVTAGSSCAAAGCNIALRFILFGRSGELFPSQGPIIK